MKYYIITGTSRGLGESLARQLIQPGHTVFCIFRSGNAALKVLALDRQAFLHYGWGAYCGTKAGLEMFTRCAGLEQQEQTHPTIIVAVAPGVVDTDMQSQIRQANPDDFPQVDRFIDMHTQGQLASPDEAAGTLIEFCHRDDLANGRVYDIRTLLPH